MRIAKLFFIIISAATLAGNASAELPPLHQAARDNNAAEAKRLIDNGAEVNAKDENGFTPLHRAAGRNAAAVAKLLIDNGADVNAEIGNTGLTPLYLAAGRNAAAVAKLLIEKGADVNAKTTYLGEMPLHRAAEYNAAAVAKLLIDNGAAVNAKDNSDQTPLHIAREENAAAVAELLLAEAKKMPWQRAQWQRAQAAPKGTEAKGKCGETLTKIDEAIREAAGISQEATPIAGLRHDILKLALTQAQSAMSAAKRHCN